MGESGLTALLSAPFCIVLLFSRPCCVLASTDHDIRTPQTISTQPVTDSEGAATSNRHAYDSSGVGPPVAVDPLVWREEFQGRVCRDRCNGTHKVQVGEPIDPLRSLSCAPCGCSVACAPQGTCCPPVQGPWTPAPTHRARCLAEPALTLSYGEGVLHVATCRPDFPAATGRHNQSDHAALCEAGSQPSLSSSSSSSSADAVRARGRDTALPVTSTSTFVTYANVHCASCNYDDDNVAEWGVECLHDQLLYSALSDREYEDRALQLVPTVCSITPNVTALQDGDYQRCDLRFYRDPLVAVCNVTGTWYGEGAQDGFAGQLADGDHREGLTGQWAGKDHQDGLTGHSVGTDHQVGFTSQMAGRDHREGFAGQTAGKDPQKGPTGQLAGADHQEGFAGQLSGRDHQEGVASQLAGGDPQEGHAGQRAGRDAQGNPSSRMRTACQQSTWRRGAAVAVDNYWGWRLYANVFCALCNGHNLSETFESPISSQLEVEVYDQIIDMRQSRPFSRTAVGLLGGGRQRMPVTSAGVTPRCPDHQWPHPRDGCRALQCAAGKKLQGRPPVCVTAVSRVAGLGYRLRLLLRPVRLQWNLGLLPDYSVRVDDNPIATLPPLEGSRHRRQYPSNNNDDPADDDKGSPTRPLEGSRHRRQYRSNNNDDPADDDNKRSPIRPLEGSRQRRQYRSNNNDDEDPADDDISTATRGNRRTYGDIPQLDADWTCDYHDGLRRELELKLQSKTVDEAANVTAASSAPGACFTAEWRSQLRQLFGQPDVTVNPTTWGAALELDLGLLAGRSPAAADQAKFLTAEVDAYLMADKRLTRDEFEGNTTEAVFDQVWEVRLGDLLVVLQAFDSSSEVQEGGEEMFSEPGGPDGVKHVRKKSYPYFFDGRPLQGLEHLFLPFTGRLLCPHLTFRRDEFALLTCQGCEDQVHFPRFLDPVSLQPLSFRVKSYPGGAWLSEGGQDLVMCVSTFLDVFPQNVTLLEVPAGPRRGSSFLRQVLSLVCGGVSVVCLALTLLTYALFRSLRSLPGLNNTGLSASLLAANLSLLLPWHRTGAGARFCRAVGVLTHWLWLAALGWMGVCCLHMARTFAAKTRRRLDERGVRRVFRRSALAVASLSTAVVLLTAVGALAASGGSSMGYGGLICFLDTDFSRLLLLAFVGPLVLLVVANLTCFLVTVVSIVRVRRLQGDVGGAGGGGVGGGGGAGSCRDVLVYAKLTTVTGGAWLLGLLAEAVDSEWMRVLAELCTAAQGLLLFLAYVCNARVWALYRGRFRSSSPQSATATTTTETTTNATAAANTITATNTTTAANAITAFNATTATQTTTTTTATTTPTNATNVNTTANTPSSVVPLNRVLESAERDSTDCAAEGNVMESNEVDV